MTQRRVLLLAVVLLLALGAAAVWLLLSTRNRTGESLTEVAGTAQPPLPTVLATPAGTRPSAVGRPGSATATPTPAPLAPPGGPGGLDLDAPPTLDELLARYPALALRLENVDLTGREQLAEVYEQLVALYEAEGLAGLDVFMTGSGLLAALNLDPAYLDFVLAYETGGMAAAETLARQRRLLTDDDQLRAVLVLDTEDLSLVEPGLIAAGAAVLHHAGNEVEIGIPLAQIEAAASSEAALARLVALAHLPHVVTIRAPQATPIDALPPRDEGATVTHAATWHAAGYTGRGVRVGILDPDGFYGYQSLLGSELPVTDLVFTPPWYDADQIDRDSGPHGTACAEIVHDVAPDAALYLAYTGPFDGGLERAVAWLIDSNVDIISYSASSLIEPLDGTGPTDELVALAQDAGILWINASGNYAESHLDMTFTDVDGNGFHEFPHGDELLPVYVNDLSSVGLSWDDAWGGSSEDYDLFLYTLDASGRPQVVMSSRDLQDGRAGDHPYELLDAHLSPFDDYYLAILEDGISRPGRLNLTGWGMMFDYSMAAGSLGSPADAFGALAVGATYWRDDALERYSSQGPTTDGRTKPDLVAPVRVSNATYGEFDGTSAAAPHVAGAAALALSAYPDLDTRALRDFLTSRALDRGVPGPDNEFGAGRLDMQTPPDGVSRAAGPLTATIHAVRLVHNQIVSGITGVVVYTDFSVTGLTERAGMVIAHFNDAAGRALPDGNGQFSDGAGSVAVFETFTATADSAHATEYPLFMPYDELELPPGEHTVLVTVTIGDAAGHALVTSAPVSMIVERAGDMPAATITAVEVVHNVTVDGLAGMNILVDFDALNLRDQTATMAAYFYFDDANNTPLKDFNDQYRGSDGIVAAGRSFMPGSNRAAYQDLALFMPYGELHMGEGERYELKFQIVIWDEATGENVVVSDWVYFWFES